MGLRRSSVDMDAFANSMTFCDLDIWPPESNPIISWASEYFL